MTTAFREAAAARILNALKARDWTQTDLAQRLGVQSTTVNNWLKGIRRVKPRQRHRIARALEMRVEDIWGVK